MNNLLDLTGFRVDDVPDVSRFIDRVREFAAGDLEAAHFWVVAAGPTDVRHEDHVELEFGVSTAPGVAALTFGQRDGQYVPAGGTNEDEVDYQLAGLHPSYLPPGAEVPLPDMLTALEEFLRTHQRPTSITWVPAD
ncbi:Immunity protein Imm1 [Prauserella aidingensis]|uniref:Imm1 family immunity protein n=1 Tax=Prauserella aidingensis TaxID=387890 RepID=UPI0020A57FE5|nr:Imm1 family immunity protein [Prauserella aidingensis]MCP2254321.1 Immunity protein Imm1 [Prauserella aidingensis]